MIGAVQCRRLVLAGAGATSSLLCCLSLPLSQALDPLAECSLILEAGRQQVCSACTLAWLLKLGCLELDTLCWQLMTPCVLLQLAQQQAVATSSQSAAALELSCLGPVPSQEAGAWQQLSTHLGAAADGNQPMRWRLSSLPWQADR